jgi:hypothetical protein
MKQNILLKKYLLLLTLIFNFGIIQAQTFWTENFNNGCTAACLASSYTGPNGTWSLTPTGTNNAEANE